MESRREDWEAEQQVCGQDSVHTSSPTAGLRQHKRCTCANPCVTHMKDSVSYHHADIDYVAHRIVSMLARARACVHVLHLSQGNGTVPHCVTWTGTRKAAEAQRRQGWGQERSIWAVLMNYSPRLCCTPRSHEILRSLPPSLLLPLPPSLSPPLPPSLPPSFCISLYLWLPRTAEGTFDASSPPLLLSSSPPLLPLLHSSYLPPFFFTSSLLPFHSFPFPTPSLPLPPPPQSSCVLDAPHLLSTGFQGEDGFQGEHEPPAGRQEQANRNRRQAPERSSCICRPKRYEGRAGGGG